MVIISTQKNMKNCFKKLNLKKLKLMKCTILLLKNTNNLDMASY